MKLRVTYDEPLSNVVLNGCNPRPCTTAFYLDPRGSATVVYVCSARVTSLTLLKKSFKRYFLSVGTSADCSDTVPADVLYSPEDQFKARDQTLGGG